MRDRKIAIKAVHDALRATRRVEGLLETFTGEALARLYEEQKKPSGPSVPQEREYIVGAQPMIHPGLFDARLMIDPKGIKQPIPITEKDWEQFYVSSVMVGWWYTKTVAQFDLDMLGELFDTDDSELMISLEQCCKFLGSPVLIPFEKPYHDNGADILGCIVGFATDNPIGFNGLNSFVFLPVFMDPETELPNFAVGLARFNTRDKKQALPLRDLIGSVAEAQDDGGIPGFSLYRKELTSKLAYLLTETPDVNRCMSVSEPAIKRPRRRPETIFPPERPRFMPLGEEFGNLIRQYREREAASGHTIHGTVRPHIRRAHWHTFLMGAGREKRTLKWLPPTFVKSAELSEG